MFMIDHYNIGGLPMDAIEFLNSIVNQRLCYGIKSPDLDLYDFGFSNGVSVPNLQEEIIKSCTCFIHATCRFKVVWRSTERRVDKYCEDTPCEIFHSEITRLVGLRVKRVELRDKNDLLLDFGDCWVVFVTFEDEKESWRFFSSDKRMPHLVVSGYETNFVY